MKTKQILALILAVILGGSIVPMDARAEDPGAYAPNGYQEIGSDTNSSLFNDPDTMYSITEGSLHVPYQGQSASFILDQDSYVEFDSKAGHDAWSLDEVKQGGTSGLIYSMDLPKRFLLKKGYHYMHLASATLGGGATGDGDLTYKIYPICGIYYPSGNGYEKVTSYTLQSHSQTMDIPERSFSGYTFEGWYEDEGLTIPFTSVDMSIGKDWYVYPKLTPIVYTITYEMNGGVNNLENPNGYTIEDKKITLQPPTKEGYKFSRWYILSGGKKVTVTEINAPDLKNIKVFAEWSEQEYSITYENVDKHGNPSIYKASNGTIALDPPSKRKGYEFAGWYLDAACTRSITKIDCSMKKNITIYAKWKPISYTIIYELNGGRQNTDNPNGYTIEDEKVALQPPTKDGTEFEGWFTDPAFKKKITEIDPANCIDIKLYAKWKKKSSGANASPTPKPSITPTLTPTPTKSPTVTAKPDKDPEVTEKPEGGSTDTFQGNLLPGPVLKADYYVRWSYGSVILMECTSKGYEGLDYVFELSYDGVKFQQLPGNYRKDDPIYTYTVSNPDVDTIDTYYVRARQTGETTINGGRYQGTRYSNVVELFCGMPSMEMYSPMLKEQEDGSYCLPIGSEVPFYTKSGCKHTVWKVSKVRGSEEREEVLNGVPADGCTISDTGVLKINNDPDLIGDTIRVSSHLPQDVDTLNELPYDTKVIRLTARTEDLHIYHKNKRVDKLNLRKGQTVTLTVKNKSEEVDADWESEDEDVAGVDPDGMVTAVGKGTARITAFTEDGMFLSVLINVDVASQKLKVEPGSLKLYEDGRPKTLKISNAKGNPLYKSSDPGIAEVNKKGVVTPVSKGTTTIAITDPSGTVRVKVTVYGKLTKVKNVKAAPVSKKSTVRVSWNKMALASGYIIRYSYKKNMAGSKNIKITGRNTCSRTIKKLRSKKYLYIQVQAYIKDGDRLVKGPWSNVIQSKGKIR